MSARSVDNPYQSPEDGSRGARRFRLGRMLLIVAGLLLLVVGPIVWHANREGRAQQRAIENLQQIGEALKQYQAREQAGHAAPPQAGDRAMDDWLARPHLRRIQCRTRFVCRRSVKPGRTLR